MNGRSIKNLILFAALLVFMLYEMAVNHPQGPYNDFGAFMVSGHAVADGQNPYVSYRRAVYGISFDGAPDGAAPVNLNPPASLLLFRPLANLELHRAFTIWYVLSLVCYLATLALIGHARVVRLTPVRIAWALALPPLWETLWLGQIYVFLALVVAGAWLLLERRQFAAAGMAIGIVVAIKPNFVVWPLLLGVSGFWSIAVLAIIVAAALNLVPVAVFGYGPALITNWLHALPSAASALAVPTNVTLSGLAARLGLPLLGVPLSAALLGALAYWAWRRRPPVLDVTSFSLVAACLAAPLIWPHYFLLFLPIFLARRWTVLWGVAACLVLAPDTFTYGQAALSHARWIAAGSIGFVSILAVLLALVGDEMPNWLGAAQRRVSLVVCQAAFTGARYFRHSP